MKLHSSEDGSILVEFALVLTPLILILACMVNYALWIQKEMQIQDAASAAAAAGAVPGAASNHLAMQYTAAYIVTGSPYNYNTPAFTATATDFYVCTPGGSHVTATTSCSGTTPFHYVQVVTSATMPSLLGFRGIASSMNLVGQATYRVEVTP
jgi:Flp pilus assembly protein TadG